MSIIKWFFWRLPLDTTNSLDIEHQKFCYYVPRSGHTVKLITLVNCQGKFESVFPLCSSQSPTCGDVYLTATYNNLSNYLRKILEGNSEFFIILIVDAGFVMESRRQPPSVANIPSLIDICTASNAVILHTSDKHQTYHLVKNASGKIVKAPRNPALETLSENTIAYSRTFRKINEQAHGGT